MKRAIINLTKLALVVLYLTALHLLAWHGASDMVEKKVLAKYNLTPETAAQINALVDHVEERKLP